MLAKLSIPTANSRLIKMHLRPDAAERTQSLGGFFNAKHRQLQYVTQHNIIVVCEIFSNFAHESRDMWCLRGGFTPGIGWFVYIRKAFISVLFLGFLKIWPFSETIVKSEAMVEAPGKFMLPSIHYIPSIGIVGLKFRIYLLRG